MEVLLNDLYRKLRAKNQFEKFEQEYSLLKTDEDRVKFTINIFKENDIKFEINGKEKNKSDATQYNEKATTLYISQIKSGKKMDLDSIIKLYTKSVAYAPVNSYILSLAYANRSLALFKARLYRDCIDDIEHALLLGCSEKLKIKLDARKVRCHQILNSPNSTLEKGNFRELEKASKQLEKVDLNAKTVKSDESVSKNNEFIKLDGNRNLPQVPNDNEEIPGASSAIKLVYSEEFGRYVVATRDIEPGEVLAVQQGYVSNLFLENFYSHCIYCMKQTWSGIPCDKCVYAIYCSENCRKAAWINHHDIECQVVGPLIDVDMENLGLMSLRLLVSAYKETEDLQVLKNHIKVIDSLTGKYYIYISFLQEL